MIGVSLLLDTNILINHLRDKDLDIFSLIEDNIVSISIIWKIELLGYHKITNLEKGSIRKLLNVIEVIELDDDVSEIAIKIRQDYNMKTPDSIIAATAINNNIPLLTADGEFSKVRELELIKYS